LNIEPSGYLKARLLRRLPKIGRRVAGRFRLASLARFDATSRVVPQASRRAARRVSRRAKSAVRLNPQRCSPARTANCSNCDVRSENVDGGRSCAFGHGMPFARLFTFGARENRTLA
jgi:hypothetical protein